MKKYFGCFFEKICILFDNRIFRNIFATRYLASPLLMVIMALPLLASRYSALCALLVLCTLVYLRY
jgi:hypothetical protein